MPFPKFRSLVSIACLLQFQTLAQEASVSFSSDIAPVLAEKCLTCHGAEKTKGRYRVDTIEGLFAPGSSEAIPVRPGAPESSELFRRLTTSDEADRMPQDAEPLPPEEIERFRRWITEGAKLDKGDPSTAIITLIPRKAHPAPPAELPNPVPVLAVAFNSSGTEIAVSGYHQVQIRGLDGKLLRTITNVVQRVHALVFHPDGRSLVVAGGHPGRGGEAAFYDLKTGELIATPVRAPDEMLCLAISLDGQTLAIGGSDNTIHIVDGKTGQPARRIQQHADWVTALAFSPDGKHLASASRDRTARVYDVASGELMTAYVEHDNPLYAVAFLDPERVISGGRDRSAHVWKIEDGKKQSEIGGFKAGVLGIIKSEENLFILSGREIALYKAEDRSLLQKFAREESALFSMAFHAPSKLLMGGAYDGTVTVWASESGELRAQWPP